MLARRRAEGPHQNPPANFESLFSVASVVWKEKAWPEFLSLIYPLSCFGGWASGSGLEGRMIKLYKSTRHGPAGLVIQVMGFENEDMIDILVLFVQKKSSPSS